ncbi:PEP-CTERM sorting domain-containing protein [Bowmanella denitrificans]|uniref:PEP-CTERM sorting domain-containing protein n=1 Tax=Bowmanella denitrificans TaxID=366582 RepID=UPI000C99FEBA|nr:PEP-CTERM sorting domain-containing protein [Bowmanella denitrificans]
MKKFILGALVALVSTVSIPTFAAVINVGGVSWDPEAPSDFSGVSAVLHQDIDPVTGVVSGYGRVTTLNGMGFSTFCSGCELTLQFGGFTPIGGAALPSPAGSVITYAGGWLNLYVDFTPETDPFDHASLSQANTGDEAGSNALWLSLAGHETSGISFTGTANGDGFGNFLSLGGSGFFDVVGGLAAANLDTNTIARPDGTFADLRFFSSFTINVGQTSSDGSANFSGSSIPEPGTLAVFALGVLGLSFASRRKS